MAYDSASHRADVREHARGGARFTFSCTPSAEQKFGVTMAEMAASMKKYPGALTSAMFATVCVFLVVTGCRKSSIAKTSLASKVAGPVKDLTAIRVGDQISLKWTTPRKGISKLLVHGSMKMRVCRLEGADGGCIETGPPLLLAPGAMGTFAEDLSAMMASGPPRVLYYSLELLDRDGRPTGLANRVPTLVGAPPVLVLDLTAEITEKGIVLRWKPGSTESGAGQTTIRLHRTEGVPPVVTEEMREGLVPFPPSRPEKDLLATDGAASVIDPSIHKGTIYQYRAQRVFRLAVNGQALEMDGDLSPEVRVDLSGEPQ